MTYKFPKTWRVLLQLLVSLGFIWVSLDIFYRYKNAVSFALLIGVLAAVLLRSILRKYLQVKKRPDAVLLYGLAFIGLIAIFAGLTWFPPLDVGRILLDSLKYTILLTVLLTGVVVRFKGKLHMVWKTRKPAQIFLSLLFTYLLLCAGLEILLNGWLDASAATPHATHVVDWTINSRAFGTQLQLESWRQPSGFETLNISSYERAVPTATGWTRIGRTTSIPDGTTRMTVFTKPGRFGFEWVESHRFE